MSEDEAGDSGGKLAAFVMGFVVGVLVCLGAGGALFAVQMRQQQAEAMRARDMAEMARHEAMRAEAEARKHREIAEKALRAVKEAKEKKDR